MICAVAPYSQPLALLKLNCLVFGDGHRQIFTVKIAGTENVSELKKMIRGKKVHAFSNMDANDLLLWKVSLPADENLQAAVADRSFVEKESLEPIKRLSESFPDAPIDSDLHIVVKPVQAASPKPLPAGTLVTVRAFPSRLIVTSALKLHQ